MDRRVVVVTTSQIWLVDRFSTLETERKLERTSCSDPPSVRLMAGLVLYQNWIGTQ